MRRGFATVVLMLVVFWLPGATSAAEPALNLTTEELDWIGRQVFRNECNAREECLVHWNQGEAFPSLGIGHFIWYPTGMDGPFLESFPSLVAFLRTHGADLPEWLVSQASQGAPWPDREAFLQAQERADPRVDQLRQMLGAEKALQAAFMADRAAEALAAVVAASRHPQTTRDKMDALAATPGGLYALVDYVNFKGEGLSPSERYQDVGWGLLQVLEDMPGDGIAPPEALEQFRLAAGRVLTRRAELSGRPVEKQWLAGWLNRVDTYREPK